MAIVPKQRAAVIDKPNRLLPGLIVVSFILHGTALLCMPDTYHATKTSLIELTLEEIPRPAPLIQQILCVSFSFPLLTSNLTDLDITQN